MSSESRLVVVSNRIPTDDTPSGGLVVALHDALKDEGGLWIGHSGRVEDEVDDGLSVLAEDPYARMAFDLSTTEHRGFYLCYANSVLWPLFHRRPDLITLDAECARIYREVNARVARLVAAELKPGDRIWIHDYHFLPLAHELRDLGVDNRIGYFLHIPMPTAPELPALPEAADLPRWLAAYDVVGVQTQRDVRAALDVLRAHGGAELLQDGQVSLGGRTFEIGAFPIGIDVDDFAEAAEAAPPGRPALRLEKGEKLLLGVDRLDYSKGLPNRFAAFGAFLQARDSSDVRATLLQIAPPSREDVEAYQDIREELETMSGRVNGQHAALDWTPIRYIRRPIDRAILAGLYRTADAMLVTPLADGMNLVAKEFVAAQDPDDPGVLILSHFAGAAEQMTEALLVNPYDEAGTAASIETALTMPLAERKRRHARLLEGIRDRDIGWWTRSFLSHLNGQRASAAA